jgi:hypothetical protein
MEDLKTCQKPTKYGQAMFCEAVKVDMANSLDLSFNHTIASTLSLITVLFEDLFEAITMHKDYCGEKLDPHPSMTLLSKTNTLNGYDFNINIFADEFNSFVFFLHDLSRFPSMRIPLCCLKNYLLIQTSACCVAF